MYGAWATGGTLAGNGESNNPYMIADDADWETFAGWINNANTHNNYYRSYYKLAADITVSTMVGVRDGCPFSGNFNGDGHTITANIVSTATGDFLIAC